MESLKDLKPERVFHYFGELMKIPRPSGHEKEVSDYLVKTGKELDLETFQDENLNVLLKRKASPGFEDSKTVTLQGHMDMVGAKTTDSSHDFTKDPIIPIVKDGFLTAKDTTLGADNGIAVAMGLALLEDENYIGPNLELLVTTEEETSMSGAINLSDDLLEGDYLINIDSEEEGVLTVGSAGGLTIFISEDLEVTEERKGIKLSLSGLIGGHSGMEIHENRGNAVKILGDILSSLPGDFTIGQFNSGSLDNVIPSEGEVIVFGVEKEKLEKVLEKTRGKYKNLLGDLSIKLEEASGKSYSLEQSKRFIRLITECPSGVYSKMKDGKTVESSNNLAFIREGDEKLKSEISLRSSNEEVLEKLKKEILEVVEENGFSYKIGSDYPGWEYNENSRLRPLAEDLYKRMTGKEFDTVVIHAGLECGALYKKYPNLDIISIGPNITGAHSVKEKVEISSVERVYEFLVELLKELK